MVSEVGGVMVAKTRMPTEGAVSAVPVDELGSGL